MLSRKTWERTVLSHSSPTSLFSASHRKYAAEAETPPPRPRKPRSSQDSKQASTSRIRVKTRRMTADLPHMFVKDGAPAQPLPEFCGGLEPARAETANLLSPDRIIDGENKHPTAVEDLATSREGRRPSNVLAQEILANLDRFPHCILLTKVGQFYESYFEQARMVAELLSIKLTTRKWDGKDVLMAGFPVLQTDRHLKTLVQAHRRPVAICDEFRHEDQPEKLSRRVTRIITPGTLIDEPFINPFENNFLLAVSSKGLDGSELGLAWIDVSTGEFFSEAISPDVLKDELARIAPQEIVLDTSIQSEENAMINSIIKDVDCHVAYTANDLGCPDSMDAAPSVIQDDITSTSQAAFFGAVEASAISLLTGYLRRNLLDNMPQMVLPTTQRPSTRMYMDGQTLKALEIREGLRDGGRTGSLLSVIRRTVTQGGTRLLSRWLCSPSLSLSEIIARQNIVSLFFSKPFLRDDIIQSLKKVEDAARLIQKLLLGKGSFDDLVSLRATFLAWDGITRRVLFERETESRSAASPNEHWASLSHLLSQVADLAWLATQIENAVSYMDVKSKERPFESTISREEAENDVLVGPGEEDVALDALAKPPYGNRWKLKASFSRELQRLHRKLATLIAEKNEMEFKLRNSHEAPSLSLRLSPSLGPHVHLARARRDACRFEGHSDFVPIHQNNSTRAYFHRPWLKLCNLVLGVVADIIQVEKIAFEKLRSNICGQMWAIRRNARIMDELDVMCGFAKAATEMKLVRPNIDNSTLFLTTNARHPTVELGLLSSGRTFTPNDLDLNDRSRIHIITGPNMAGKSTFLRQTALIAILAQTGSFVPCQTAQVGIVDKVFSRVGASDDLYRDRSTFMVEMLETANILKVATGNSLVIMDEIGRGTTVKDGLAIAFATVHHLYHTNRSRVLFATHFHELADLLGYRPDAYSAESAFPFISFFCNDVDEIDTDNFAYSHKLRPGVNRESHGLKVARLAGIPLPAITIAEEVLGHITRRQIKLQHSHEDLNVLGKALSTHMLSN